MDFAGGTALTTYTTTEGGVPVVYFDRGPGKAEDIYRAFDSLPPPLP
jgi:hypothetical protein